MSKGYTLRKHLKLIERDGPEAEVCPWCERLFSDIAPRLTNRRGKDVSVVVTLEHTVAKRDGGSYSINNLVRACVWCNERRERLAQEGVQDDDALLADLLVEEQQRQAERERRKNLLFEYTGRGWARKELQQK